MVKAGTYYMFWDRLVLNEETYSEFYCFSYVNPRSYDLPSFCLTLEELRIQLNEGILREATEAEILLYG